jgi:4'-phosphopantetheinyl transferase
VNIPEDEIHVFKASLDCSEEMLVLYKELLSVDERLKAKRFKFERDKKHYTAGRGTLRELLGRYLGESPSRIKFSYTDKGKPFLKNSAVKFNIAHSGGMAVFALSSMHELGIDIEILKDKKDAVELAKRFFSEDEIKDLDSVPKEKLTESFFNCWTRKEAFIKALGKGLSYSLTDFSVSLRPGDEPRVKWIKDKNEDINDWRMFDISIDDNYISSLAVKAKNVNVVLQLACLLYTSPSPRDRG